MNKVEVAAQLLLRNLSEYLGQEGAGYRKIRSDTVHLVHPKLTNENLDLTVRNAFILFRNHGIANGSDACQILREIGLKWLVAEGEITHDLRIWKFTNTGIAVPTEEDMVDFYKGPRG